MKIYFILVFTLFSINGFCQILNSNNVSSQVGGTPGLLYQFDNSVNFSSYILPQNSGIGALHTSSLWCAGLEDDGSLHLAAARYSVSGHDFFNGPVSSSNAYSDPIYQSTYGSIFTKQGYVVTKNEVQNHIANFNQVGYVQPSSITNWPGNGLTNLGVSQNLAPFIDMNGNGIYEPGLGDYPDIRGDKAIFQIFNDARGVHTESGGTPLGIEVHLLYYQFASSDYKNDATFVHARIFNRGTKNYPIFKLGIWNDYLFGNPEDNFVGCDTLTNLTYVYNNDNLDGDSIFGYGLNPPAFGLVSVGQDLEFMGFMHNTASFPYNDPTSPISYYNYMQGKWSDGSSWYYGGNGTSGSTTTHFIFPGNPNDVSQWSQMTTGSTPIDGRTISTFESENLMANQHICYDFAFIYARESGNNHLQNVNSLISIAAQAKSDFDAMTSNNCNQVTLDLSELDEFYFLLYPNPSNGSFYLNFGKYAVSGNLNIYDVSGRPVFQQRIENENEKQIFMNELNGVYILSLQTEKGERRKKISIQH